jgi:hypothetical protein
MSDQTMQDVLSRLDAQEKELARLRAARPRRSKLFGGRRRRGVTLGIVALLVALVPLSILAATPFTDLNEGSVHNPDIDTAYNLGIANGFEDPNNPSARLYYPSQNVTREEMASFLVRTAGLNRIGFDSRSTAAPTDDIGADTEKEYLDVTIDVPGREGDAAVWVKVSFTGYAYARSAVSPTLLRGEIRLDGETTGPARIVTRTVIGANPLAIVGAPASGTTPAVAAAERLDFSGSRVFALEPGTYTFRMVVVKEVGTATDVGFGFGNMQAETVAFGPTGTRGTVTPAP